MDANQDLNSVNITHCESQLHHDTECSETMKNHIEDEKNEVLQSKDCSNNSDTIFNNITKGKHGVESIQSEDEINNFSSTHVNNILNKIAQEKDGQSDPKNDENGMNKDKQEIDTKRSNKLSEIIDSDSEDENIFTSNSKKKNIFYDKSSDEMSDCEHEKGQSNYKSTVKKIVDDSNDNNSDIEEIVPFDTSKMRLKLQTLIDSESEDEREINYDEDSTVPEEHNKKTKKYKKDSSKEKESSKKKISYRASKEQAMKQIQSETQRLVRESRISLPYHIPKQRTVQEFFNRMRKTTFFPEAHTMAATLKMPSVIESIDEILREKEEEAEIFYKSSDSEEDIAEVNGENIDNEQANAECAQNTAKDNVTRKLFTDDNLVTIKYDEKEDSTIVLDRTLTEIKEIENIDKVVQDRVENDGDKPVVTEVLEESAGTESKERNLKFGIIPEAAKNNETETLLEEGVIESNNNDKNIFDNTNIHNVETVDVDSGPSTSNADNSELSTSKVDNSGLSTSIIGNPGLSTSKIDDPKPSTSKIDDPKPSTSKVDNDYAKMVRLSLGITDESDDYNEYGLPPPKFDESPIMNEKKKSLWDLKTLKPQLKGTPGAVIDLTDDVKPSKKGVNDLIGRFFSKHSKINQRVNNKINVTAIQVKESPNGLSIIKETLPYRQNVTIEDPALNKPGAKLKRLKEELKQKMALKREEEWKQREQEMKEQEIEWNDSINEEENLSEPYSPSIESHRSEEDELLEEDDVYTKKEKKKKKCAFIDDKAEVSEDEINHSDEIEDEDENEEEDEDEDEDEDEIHTSSDKGNQKVALEDEDNSTCDSNDATTKSKTFKRIVLPVEEEDSVSSTIENNENDKNEKTFSLQIPSKNTFNNENEDFIDNESYIPMSQAPVENSSEHQMSQTPQIKSNTFDFISPATQLTALNARLEEESPRVNEKSTFNDDLDSILVGNTQIRDSRKLAMSQRKLFTDYGDVSNEELLELCSGKFTDDMSDLNFTKEPDVSESQLLEICSGAFTSQVNNNIKPTDSSDEVPQSTQVSAEKNSLSVEKDEQDSEVEIPSRNKLRLEFSDEEDSIEMVADKLTKKKVKKLNLSDDEEENSSVMSSDEEEDEEKFVDYDSEENEVIVPKKDIKAYAANFLEDEAELSGSDCDVSADEDEQDLDKLDIEDGDDEDIDDAQVKNQLGKLHMKQMMDEDQKEVKMLKELLFEDGDLYSESARERKFKWKNIDKEEENSNDFQPLEDKDGLVNSSEDEEESKWRKMRYERDKFLAKRKMENMNNVDTEVENNLNNSRIFRYGLKLLKKRRIDEFQKQDTMVETLESNMEPKVPGIMTGMNITKEKSRVIHNVMQKHSFLARGEESLARLAVLAKKQTASLSLMKAKNFVFTHIDVPTENNSATVESNVFSEGKRSR